MKGPLAHVKPEMLRWARSSARLTVEAAARRFGVDVPRLAMWESGEDKPTLAQLRGLAAIYKRPLCVFYLPQPPKGWDAMRDARRMDLDALVESPELAIAIREAWEKRSVAVELLADHSSSRNLFDVRASMDDDPEVVGGAIRSALEPPTRSVGLDADRAYVAWRSSVERAGVLVFSFSDVAVDEIRGFSISEDPVSAVAINSGDRPAARSFTLMHELAHVALRAGGVACEPTAHADAAVEKFCNHVAGAVLVPRDELQAHHIVTSMRSTRIAEDDLRSLARDFCVSREVMLRRLLIIGRVSDEEYKLWRKIFVSEYKRWAERDRPAGAGDYVTNMMSRNGSLYTSLVLDAFANRTITLSDLSAFLGLRTKHVERLRAEVAHRLG